MTAPQRRRCAICGTLAPEASMERIGTTESKPGWCGGPRQGGRPMFAHATCVEWQDAADAAADTDRADRKTQADTLLAQARAARDAGDRAEYDRLMDLAVQLVWPT